MDWYKLTSKPSEANSGTYANIYQSFILNLGLNHMQYPVFTSNQTKNMWFVPLIKTWTVPSLTFIYTKSYPVYDKYIHDLKTNILEQIIRVSASLWLVQQTDKGAGRSSWGVFLTRCKMSLEAAINVPHFYQNIVVKLILCFTTFISKNMQILMIPFIRNMQM